MRPHGSPPQINSIAPIRVRARCSWSQVSAFQHYSNLPLASSLSQSLYSSSPPRPYPRSVLIRRPSPLLPYALDSPLPSTPLPLPRIPCLHWSRLSLSPAEPLPSVVRPADQCRLNIRYPLRSLHSPCPTLTPLPPLPITQYPAYSDPLIV